MTDLSLGFLFSTLFILILLSAFFSGSETALMRLNKYRLIHLVKSGHLGAKMAHTLLKKPDRLIGLILLGNNFINIFASSIATILALRLYGESGIAIAAGLLTFIILIFSEVAPKTWAASHPERLAFFASIIYTPLLKLLYPLVWVINTLSNLLLRMVGIHVQHDTDTHLHHDELRTVVTEAGNLIPDEHKGMLLGILDLQQATVEDIMTPINDIHGIDLDDDIDDIKKQLLNASYSNLPVFSTNMDSIQGFLRTKDILQLANSGDFSHQQLLDIKQPPYFIPNNTSLYKQLINFQQNKQRFAFVVNEYGSILGLITLQDLLEEVIGEFTTDFSDSSPDIQKKADGSILVSGNITIRELNRSMGWKLPTNGPKTLNGLIIEYLESIPEQGTSLKLYKHSVEIVLTEDNAVKLAKFQSS
ncbi:MAG: Mg2+/Co2+ transporter CorB [Cycloclasticus pugetii]|nr:MULTISPECIES: HlyC/CorC family transporter [Cycloclasticus]ATI03617.1 HlyC/CorC family transporter [Cycloclasticus sp. PY97N]MBV1898256.1 HlyC/CorC family transporter [Cycloclasticus sp.]MDF1829087.1 HlyC/CorC family transporter [Cycloclasticus pugetii]